MENATTFPMSTSFGLRTQLGAYVWRSNNNNMYSHYLKKVFHPEPTNAF